jgi:hypothetical protein
MVNSSFANEKSLKGFFLIWLYWLQPILMYFGVYICKFTLCFMFMLQILFVAALDIKTRDAPTVGSINSLLSQYCKVSNIFCKFLCTGGAPTVRFAPVIPWAKTGPWQKSLFVLR